MVLIDLGPNSTVTSSQSPVHLPCGARVFPTAVLGLNPLDGLQGVPASVGKCRKWAESLRKRHRHIYLLQDRIFKEMFTPKLVDSLNFIAAPTAQVVYRETDHEGRMPISYKTTPVGTRPHPHIVHLVQDDQ